jgi:hypothetical protein
LIACNGKPDQSNDCPHLDDGLLDVLIPHGAAVFHAVDDHADAEAGSKQRAKQKKAVGRFSPGHKKDHGDDHQNFGIHAAAVYSCSFLAIEFTLVYRLFFTYLDFLF